MITISDFENFIKENDCSDMVTINHSKLSPNIVELWFWISLKQNNSRALILDRDWLKLVKQRKKKK